MKLPTPRPLFFAVFRVSPRWLRAFAIRVAVPRAPAGAAILLFDEEGALLLVRHTYQRGDVWSLPGGWARRREDLRQTAVREAREELGIVIVAGAPLATSRGPFGDVAVVFEARLAEPGTPLVLDAEIAEARFFPVEALPPLFGHARRMVTQALAQHARLA